MEGEKFVAELEKRLGAVKALIHSQVGPIDCNAHYPEGVNSYLYAVYCEVETALEQLEWFRNETDRRVR